MEQREKLERRERREISRPRAEETSFGGGSLLLLVGGAALAVVAVGLIVSLPDIKRYYKISTM